MGVLNSYVPRPVWCYPIDTEKSAYVKVETEFFFEFSLNGQVGWLVGFGHTTGCVPVGFVCGINQQQTPLHITNNRVRADPFAGLRGVTFG